MRDKASLQLRAQEIINASPDGMTTKDALKQAILERYRDDPTALADLAASLAQSTMKGLRRRTYELPDRGQVALFDIPTVIANRTKDGDLIVPRDHANVGQVQQWQREGDQYHSTQALRFKRFGEDLKPLASVDASLPWQAARRMLSSAPVDSENENDG